MKIALCLIHNHDPERLARIRPDIAALQSALSKKYEVKTFEAAWQPDKAPLSIVQALMRTITFCRSEFGLRRKNGDPTGLRQIYRSFIWRFFNEAISIVGGGKDGTRTSLMIQAAITDKILRNLSNALDWQADLIISFEDDAVFRESSIAKVTGLVDRIRALPQNELFYADIAGGLNHGWLDNPDHVDHTEDGLAFYKDFQVNTTCVFAINYGLAAAFLQVLTANPNYRRLPIDWLFDRLIVDLKKSGRTGTCCHFSPPAIDHGSFTGAFDAWER